MDEQHITKKQRARRLRRIALGYAILILVILVFHPARTAQHRQAAAEEILGASGIIQAREIAISSEFGGRIAEIPVASGGRIGAGQLLVQLDTSLLDTQIEAARAAVAWAEAGRALALAGARPGQIAVAEAQLAQAEAARVAARQAVSDTMRLVENPQDIRLQIAVTQAQAEAAQYHVARAVALKDAAETAKNAFEGAQAAVNEMGGAGRRKTLIASGSIDALPPDIIERLPALADGVYQIGDLEVHINGSSYQIYRWININVPLELHLTPNQWWQAWVGVNAALAQQEGIQRSLGHLYAQQTHPQNLEAQVDEALASLAQAEAHVSAAQAQLEGLRAGATREQIAALEARVAQAEAALDSLLMQRGMMEVTAPIDGVVLDIVVHPGEVAAPGATLLTVADLSELHLIVYLPETEIGRVRRDQVVEVKVDSFPDRVFKGRVTHISDRAEFTPRNVATKDERVNLVFAVEILLPNDSSALKPGMPADAEFTE